MTFDIEFKINLTCLPTHYMFFFTLPIPKTTWQVLVVPTSDFSLKNIIHTFLLIQQNNFNPLQIYEFWFSITISHTRWVHKIFQGVPRRRISDDIHKALSEVGLLDEAGVFAKHLSGGQKRKLSIAIALIGDPKVRNEAIIFTIITYLCCTFIRS